MQTVVQRSISQRDIDVALVITSTRNDAVYHAAKRELLGNGIPSQMLNLEKLDNPSSIPWVIENVALACYAKVGGTPWVVASEHKRRELVIGISRAQDPARKFIVGFVTLFTQDGDFLFLHSQAPLLEWDKNQYVQGLTDLIVGAYREYERAHGEPEAIVLHLCKRPGRFREVEAAERALKVLGCACPYALLHLNDDSNYRLFDTNHARCVPRSGLKVDVGSRNALLLLDGLIAGRRVRRGVPRVLEVVMDKRSTAPIGQFSRLVSQVYQFAWVNWRGFNARAVPVTLNYSYLIARMIAELGADGWSKVITSGRLRDKAWFL